MPEPYLSASEDMKPTNSLKANPNRRFYKTNTEVNIQAGVIGVTGTGLTIFGAYMSYQNVKNARDPVQQSKIEAFSWAAASYFVGLGATYGSRFGGVWGGVGLSVAGSIAGGLLGRRTAEGFTISSNINPQLPNSFYNQASLPDKTSVTPISPPPSLH